MSKLIDPHNRSRSNESYARRDEVSNKYTISYEHQRDLQTYHHDSRLDTSGGPISDRIRSPAMTHKTKNQQNDSVNHLMNHEEMAKQELLRQEYEAINDMAHFKNSQSQRGNYFSKGRVMSGTTNIEQSNVLSGDLDNYMNKISNRHHKSNQSQFGGTPSNEFQQNHRMNKAMAQNGVQIFTGQRRSMQTNVYRTSRPPSNLRQNAASTTNNRRVPVLKQNLVSGSDLRSYEPGNTFGVKSQSIGFKTSQMRPKSKQIETRTRNMMGGAGIVAETQKPMSLNNFAIPINTIN